MLKISNEKYQNKFPFPFESVNNFLDEDLALKVQDEILNIEDKHWDRYDNPLEKKYTLRNKQNLPENTQKLFNMLTSEEFVENLSSVVGEKLFNDPTKNWWGVHKYDNGDKLEIHSDAGNHPVTGDKKHVTLVA